MNVYRSEAGGEQNLKQVNRENEEILKDVNKLNGDVVNLSKMNLYLTLLNKEMALKINLKDSEAI